MLGIRSTQQLQALYRQIAVLGPSRDYDGLIFFDLPDYMVAISDEQCQHCFREFGKYCLKRGTLNNCTEEYRVGTVLRSVALLLKPEYKTYSTAIKRLGDVLWEVSLDAFEYARAIQYLNDLDLSEP